MVSGKDSFLGLLGCGEMVGYEKNFLLFLIGILILLDQGPIHMTSVNFFNYLHEICISKCSNIGVQISTYRFCVEGINTQFITQGEDLLISLPNSVLSKV